MQGLRALGTVLLLLTGLTTPVLAAPATAAPAEQRSGPADGGVREQYVVTLAEAPAAGYRGDRPGLPAPRRERGRFDPDSPAARAYAHHLARERARALARAEARLGRALPVERVFDVATNGVTLSLSAAEAAAVAEVPGVVAVDRVEVLELLTDAGPRQIGADRVWEAVDPGLASKGAGIVVGIVDSGITPSNPSFAGTGPVDGHVHLDPRGGGAYLGVCDPDQPAYDATFPCNSKLIGAWDLTQPQTAAANEARDSNGHGSHVAGTAAGNVVDAALRPGPAATATVTRRISGVAPHAALVSYKVCPGRLCLVDAVLAALDQALRDGVDVINYSIAGSLTSPWSDPVSRAFSTAEQAGVVVVEAAGNSGPGAGTVELSKGAPWTVSVAASTHDRRLVKRVTGFSGGEQPPADLVGVGISGGVGPAPVVDVLDVAPTNRLCGKEFPAGTFSGAIAVCDSGTFDFRVKAARVRDAGGVGVVVVNTTDAEAFFTAITAEPLVHLLAADGRALRAWLDRGSDHRATLTTSEVASAQPDVLAGFSSRGPVDALPLLAPHVAAPGVDILAADGTGDPTPAQYGLKSGTSMASPHVAGSAALLRALQPAWSPAQVRSALLTTATPTAVVLPDGSQAGVPARGAGRVDVALASRAGLLLDEQGFAAADPDRGGDPRTLNVPELVDRTCVARCSWTRTLTATTDGTWTVETDGLPLRVQPSGPLALSAGESVTLTVTLDLVPGSTGWQYGGVTLRAPDLPAARLVVAALPAAYDGPTAVTTATRRDAGSHVLHGLRLAAPEPVARLALAPRREVTGELGQDPSRFSVFDDLSQVFWTTVEVPEGAQELVAQVLATTARDLNLEVGSGSTPSRATSVCRAASFAARESCRVARPAAGTWWVLVQSFFSSTADAVDPFRLGTAVVGAGAAEGVELAPAAPGEPRDLRFTFDAAVPPGQVLYGRLQLRSSSTAAADLVDMPVTVRRDADDVVVTPGAASVPAGEEVTHTVTIRPNVRPDPLGYALAEPLAEGTSYVEGSASGGATVADGVWRWSGTLPAAAAGAEPVVLTYRTRVDVPHVRGTATTTLISEVDDPAARPVLLTRTLRRTGCSGAGPLELDLLRVGGDAEAVPGRSLTTTLRATVTACRDVRGASVQGGTAAPFRADPSTDVGSIAVRSENKHNQVLRWELGDLRSGTTADAVIELTGTVPADAPCGGQLALTGDWTATGRGAEDVPAPPVTVPVRC